MSAFKCLCRPFCFVSLSGSSDGATLVGHSFTYDSAVPGRIVECLQEVGTMDPIIIFDELDKVADTAKGREIIGILTALIDPEQATCFRDRFFHLIDIDMSKATFVFTFNHKEQVPFQSITRLTRAILCDAEGLPCFLR